MVNVMQPAGFNGSVRPTAAHCLQHQDAPPLKECKTTYASNTEPEALALHHRRLEKTRTMAADEREERWYHCFRMRGSSRRSRQSQVAGSDYSALPAGHVPKRQPKPPEASPQALPELAAVEKLRGTAQARLAQTLPEPEALGMPKLPVTPRTPRVQREALDGAWQQSPRMQPGATARPQRREAVDLGTQGLLHLSPRQQVRQLAPLPDVFTPRLPSYLTAHTETSSKYGAELLG